MLEFLLLGMNKIIKIKAKREKFVDLLDTSERDKYPHNWCDRWCEKCSKTHLCQVYRNERELAAHYSARGMDPSDPEAILEILRKDFEIIQKNLEKEMKKKGAGFEKILEEVEKLEIGLMEPPMDFGIIKKGDEYGKKAMLFTDAILGRMRFNSYLEEKLTKHLEIINWYYTVIPIKLRHALWSIWEAKVEKHDIAMSLKDAYWTTEVIFKCVNESKSALEGVAIFESGCVKEVYNLIVMLREIEEELLKILNLSLGKHLEKSARKIPVLGNIATV